MAATVDFGYGRIAIVENGVWSCREDPDLARYLQLLQLPAGYYPDEDLALAQMAADHLGGRVVQWDEVEFVEGRVY